MKPSRIAAGVRREAASVGANSRRSQRSFENAWRVKSTINTSSAKPRSIDDLRGDQRVDVVHVGVRSTDVREREVDVGLVGARNFGGGCGEHGVVRRRTAPPSC